MPLYIKRLKFLFNRNLHFIVMGIFILCAACNQMSEHIIDDTAGLNGGFEVAKNGLPVNWLIYSPNTVPEAEFKILLDTLIFKEGRQSLKIEVESCLSAGGWKSPGLSRQLDVEKGSVYMLSFWVKSSEAEFIVRAGGVSAMSGDMKKLVHSNEDYDEWTFFEYSIPISDEFSELRMEVNILKPGIFWIDEIKIEKE